ncbi:metallophosphoesterase [Methyloceanibacter sp. wino2]|uniref:metallophosphoesterase family protein n=1 Tax=Methyloceanibacter sp. wino2 TaxID=2170729 RepID=UPI001FE11779|nr:metallophosphoesterase [Methyloceanibacter sp. wino2]
MFTLAHMSDIHLGPLPKVKGRQLLSKRLLGYVNWHRGRKFMHRRDILDLLTNDLKARSPDHIAVTGDLTNLGLPQEFPLTAEWLRNLGSPEAVTVIPGNHDAYVRVDPEKATAHWQPYMEGNEPGQALYEQIPGEFPFVRRFGDIALIGLSSAIPTAPFIAAGRLGTEQRRALGEILDRLGRDGLFRVVLIHHPPLPGQAGWRRGLRDAAEVRDILRIMARNSSCTDTTTNRASSNSKQSAVRRSSSAPRRHLKPSMAVSPPPATTNMPSSRPETAGGWR